MGCRTLTATKITVQARSLLPGILLIVASNISFAAAADPPGSAPPTSLPNAPASPHHQASADLIEAAAKELAAVAAKLPVFKLEGRPPRLRRPHPAIAALSPDLAKELLERMAKPFTGNAYQDTFIRWHLMWVVKKASPKQIREAGPLLMRLVDRMPEPAALSARPEFDFIPRAIYRKWYKFHRRAGIEVGIPPYEKFYEPPESFQFMTGQRLSRAQADLAEANKLDGQFKIVIDHDAKAYNRRIRFVNWVVRQYRGELIYALIWTGDPKVARAVMGAIERHAATRSGIAFDLLHFLYQAALDGALEQYDQQVRNDMSQRLKSIARANEGWVEYAGQLRNFADYAFHMVYLLRDEVGTGQAGGRRNGMPAPEKMEKMEKMESGSEP